MRKKVSEEYEELLHYTTAAGLSGIVNSDCLWAIHASFLNDSEEIRHFFNHRLVDITRTVAVKYLEELERDPKAASEINREGGVDIIAEKQAIVIANKLRDHFLSANKPYLFSLCAPGDEQTRRNGLLSQWRGYGQDGGYAIVFDTRGLENFFEEENNRNLYKHFECGDVFYHGVDNETQPSGSEVQEWEETLREIISCTIRENTTSESNEIDRVVTSLACLYKHRGFQEEREVRVVAVTATIKEIEIADGKLPVLPVKPVKTYLRKGMPIPYIELFAKPKEAQRSTQLPIKEIIIGPHPDSDRRKEAVKQLMEANGYSVKVTCSEIPYIGR
jgi:hypothetical protein